MAFRHQSSDGSTGPGQTYGDVSAATLWIAAAVEKSSRTGMIWNRGPRKAALVPEKYRLWKARMALSKAKSKALLTSVPFLATG